MPVALRDERIQCRVCSRLPHEIIEADSVAKATLLDNTPTWVDELVIGFCDLLLSTGRFGSYSDSQINVTDRPEAAVRKLL